MGKHEAPAFRMIIEGGRLVPATPYDAERLDTYRRGTKVSVRFTEEKDRVLVRKWWAIIGKAVKECATPWKTRDEASEAIKLALGIVNLTKTVGGEWLQYPKSLTELTDPELVDAVEQMVEIIHRVTGVDPDTWKKEIAHVGEDEPSDEVPPSDAGSGAADPSTGPAADQTVREDEAGEGATEAAHGEQAAPSSDLITVGKLQECRDKFLQIATDKSIDDEARRSVAKVALEAWRAELPEHQSFVQACLEALGRIVKGGKPEVLKDERSYLDGLIARAA